MQGPEWLHWGDCTTWRPCNCWYRCFLIRLLPFCFYKIAWIN
jgi:hypothetical protein